MGESGKSKGPVDLCSDEPVRMDANRGLESVAGLRSEQVFTACLGADWTGGRSVSFSGLLFERGIVASAFKL